MFLMIYITICCYLSFFFKKNREMLLFKLFVDIIRRKYQLNLIKVLFYLYIKKNQKKKKKNKLVLWILGQFLVLFGSQ